MQKITPFLWFNNQAEEAANFYVSVFNNSKVISVSRYGAGAPGESGTVMSVTFELEGQTLYALNGGPVYELTPAFSLFVSADTQAEIDLLWNKLLSGGGKPSRCGWLVDQFGLSWQIIPPALGKLMGDPDPVKAQRVMQAMFEMEKLDIAKLQAAYDGV